MGHPLGSPRHPPSYFSSSLTLTSMPGCPHHRQSLSVQPLCLELSLGSRTEPQITMEASDPLATGSSSRTLSFLLPHFECAVFLLLTSHPIAHLVSSLTSPFLMTPTQGTQRGLTSPPPFLLWSRSTVGNSSIQFLLSNASRSLPLSEDSWPFSVFHS